ncbi:arsenate reductase [Rhizobium sp. R72]|uniref:arsenic resistance N-acetyltransferase ArsN2 n=1 Tax=unclassified Rhizobium TaxID=2613769 RepID=UPI000B5359DE|nr:MULTISPECIES: arsenic resistance N-acetyltransferase ArsN2 [unclassified Rhizobium]OWV97362.1 arsenate reductase [Rhizobium sp. R72]OWV97701.1 arsenate reductase [Rhizobium sp. R711]
MRELKLDPTSADQELKDALSAALLPTDDIDDPGRSYFRLRNAENKVIGYSGTEMWPNNAVLLRSMVILPAFRSRGYGRRLTEMTIARTPPASDIYLVTTTAASFFQSMGFTEVSRDQVPHAILSSRQMSGLCPVSATIMKRNRPAT